MPVHGVASGSTWLLRIVQRNQNITNKTFPYVYIDVDNPTVVDRKFGVTTRVTKDIYKTTFSDTEREIHNENGHRKWFTNIHNITLMH